MDIKETLSHTLYTVKYQVGNVTEHNITHSRITVLPDLYRQLPTPKRQKTATNFYKPVEEIQENSSKTESTISLLKKHATTKKGWRADSLKLDKKTNRDEFQRRLLNDMCVLEGFLLGSNKKCLKTKEGNSRSMVQFLWLVYKMPGV